MSSSRLAAKVVKRIGQVRRLGARGLVHTAYVRTLGPSLYSLTDPARGIAAARHRQRALARAIPLRLQALRERVGALDARAAGVRIEFGTAGRFAQSLEALLDLEAAGCAVPRMIRVDWPANAIIVEAVEGSTFDECRQSGESIALIEDMLLAIHRTGYVLGPIDGDGILFTSGGQPVLRDLGQALPLAGLSRDMSAHLRDCDRHRFNELFGTQLLTAARLRTLLSPSAAIPHDRVRGCFTEVYAPVVIRDDIRWGKIWNTDLGIGRWNFIMRKHLPIPIGGRVLDLGSNNGFNPLQMLRAGAASAVGVEIDEAAIEQSRLLKSAYEWLDNRSYDFRCIHGSQASLPAMNLPRFDMVTAFCSLYYLSEAEIRDLLRYIRTRTDMLVLQCNTDRLIDRGGQEETFRKASVEFAVEMLDQAGFSKRQIIAPPGYSRPLVIGRAS